VCRPVITTDEDGNMKFIMNEGDLVFETSPTANVKFMSTDGSTMKPPEGLKGDKVRSQPTSYTLASANTADASVLSQYREKLYNACCVLL